jgi:hypothetical protein
VKVEIIRMGAHGTITLRAFDREYDAAIEFSTCIGEPAYEALELLVRRAAHELGQRRARQLLSGFERSRA